MLSYISLFSCGGVGCYGFKQQGFECIATNELLAKRLKIQKVNNKCKYETGYISGDITLDETKEEISKEIEYWKEHEGLKEVDVVIATPPCQGMSVMNHKKKGKEIPRNSLVVEAIKMVERIKPKFFIFENVPTFLKSTCLDIDNEFKPIPLAIKNHLGEEYDIIFEKVNFLAYGSNSSRTRCLTIGKRRDLQESFFDSIRLDDFLKRQKPKTIRECIGHLPSQESGEYWEEDLLHYSNKLPDHHIYWFEKVKEGQTAFEQDDVSRRPNVTNKLGDKFFRCYWDKPAHCVHTVSSNLGSQNTGHPKDNRTFSIRELMIFQTIHNEFKWFEEDITKENVKKHNHNIRECIGESVPTAIFSQIAQNIKTILER
jgi:DNA (cytosine-5)-methyltransferase 1